MSETLVRRPRWTAWCAGWAPAVALAAGCTLVVLGPAQVVASLACFALVSLTVVALRRESGVELPWVTALVTSLVGVAALGPFAVAPGWTLAVGAAMALSTPTARRVVRRGRAPAETPHHAVGHWSDGDLVRAWGRSAEELRACSGRTAGRTLTVVMWRATLLDELDRRDLVDPAG